MKYGEISFVDKLVSSIPKTLKKGIVSGSNRFKRLCSEVEKKGDFHPRLGPTRPDSALSGARRLRLAAARQAQLVEGRGDHWSG